MDSSLKKTIEILSPDTPPSDAMAYKYALCPGLYNSYQPLLGAVWNGAQWASTGGCSSVIVFY